MRRQVRSDRAGAESDGCRSALAARGGWVNGGAYPAPIALTVEAVRGNVRERVETLTGYGVRALDVTVSALTVPAGPPAPTRRTE